MGTKRRGAELKTLPNTPSAPPTWPTSAPTPSLPSKAPTPNPPNAPSDAPSDPPTAPPLLPKPPGPLPPPSPRPNFAARPSAAARALPQGRFSATGSPPERGGSLPVELHHFPFNAGEPNIHVLTVPTPNNAFLPIFPYEKILTVSFCSVTAVKALNSPHKSNVSPPLHALTWYGPNCLTREGCAASSPVARSDWPAREEFSLSEMPSFSLFLLIGCHHPLVPPSRV